MNVLAAGDLAEPITTAVTGVGAEYALVAAAGLAVALVPFATKRLWGFFKGISR